MTPSPDHPDFTAAVLGEAAPEDLAALEAALDSRGDWQTESRTIRHTAARLRAALAQDPALQFRLTPEQHAALPTHAPRTTAPAAEAATPAGSGVLIAFPASQTRIAARPAPSVGRAKSGLSRQSSGRAPRPPYRFAAASAGIAAAVALGVFLLPRPSPDLASQPDGKATAPALPASPPKTSGIPVITLEPAAPSSKTGAPLPAMPSIPRKDPVLVPGSSLENPPAPVQAIATSPPAVGIPVQPAVPTPPPSAVPRSELSPPAGAPSRHRGPAPENLASPPASR
jgi:hypothetical protein